MTKESQNNFKEVIAVSAVGDDQRRFVYYQGQIYNRSFIVDSIEASIEAGEWTLIFEMSELCNNSACFSVEIKVASDICVIFVFYDDYKSKITFA